MRRTLRSPRVWLGIAISVAAIALAARGVSWSALRQALSGARYELVLPVAAVVVLGQFARAARWRTLFGDGPRPTFGDSLDILDIGYMVSAVFPLRLGDPVRAWLVDARTEAHGPVAFATVMVERALDLLMVVALLAAVVPRPAARLLEESLGPGPWSAPGNLAVGTVAMVAILYAGMWVASIAGPAAGDATERVLRRVGVGHALAARLGIAVAGFAAGLAPLRRPATAVRALFWTLVVWLVSAYNCWLLFPGFGMDLPYAAAVFMLCATALAAILPTSPGYFGVFHAAVVFSLKSYAGVPEATSLAYALVLHAVTMLVLLLMGVVSLWRLGLGARSLAARLEGGAAGGLGAAGG